MEKNKKKRMYEPIWDKLKADGKVFVKCRHDAQRAVIKAVQKEKWLDEQKFECIGKMKVTKKKTGVEFEILTLPKPEDF